MDNVALDLLLALLGTGLVFVFVIFQHAAKTRKKIVENSPIPIYGEVDESTTCSYKEEVHKWEELKMTDAFSKTQNDRLVCMKCGLINGFDKQFNPRSLKMIIEEKARIDDLNAFYDNLDAFRKTELERTSDHYGPNKQVFLDGYVYNQKLEEQISQKIHQKRVEQFEKMLTEKQKGSA